MRVTLRSQKNRGDLDYRMSDDMYVMVGTEEADFICRRRKRQTILTGGTQSRGPKSFKGHGSQATGGVYVDSEK